jgi:hypothetical protein
MVRKMRSTCPWPMKLWGLQQLELSYDQRQEHAVFLKDRRRRLEGEGNASQLKFITGTRPISQNRPDVPLF